MSWRPHGRAEVDADDPRAFAVCDRCGFWLNHHKLRWQWQWVGPQLANLRLLVCDKCLDEPQEQLRTILIPPDPEPIWNARPENFTQSRFGVLTTQDDEPLITSTPVGVPGDNLTLSPPYETTRPPFPWEVIP